MKSDVVALAGIFLLLLSISNPATANPAARIVYELPDSVAIGSGGEALVKVKLKIPAGNHIYVGHEEESSTVLLNFQIDSAQGIQIAEVKRPRGKPRGPDRILEKEGEVQLKIFELQGRSVGSSVNAEMAIRVQMCSNEGICYEPYTHKEKILFLIHAEKRAARDHSSNIAWLHSLSEAGEKARTRKQNLFAIITAPWCGACRYMEQKAFRNPEVQSRLNEKLVPLRILDTSPERAHFRYNGYPTLIIRNPEGKELYNRAGAMDAPAFLSLLAPYTKEPEGAGTPNNEQKNEKLILAIYQKNSAAVRGALADGANASALHGTWSALMLAVYFDQPEIARQLLENGADTKYAMAGGWTALSLAEAYGRQDLIGILQKQGQRPRSPVGRPPVPGKL